jgi:hypothetical protein
MAVVIVVVGRGRSYTSRRHGSEQFHAGKATRILSQMDGEDLGAGELGGIAGVVGRLDGIARAFARVAVGNQDDRLISGGGIVLDLVLPDVDRVAQVRTDAAAGVGRDLGRGIQVAVAIAAVVVAVRRRRFGVG